jgi:hypothetical protein
MSDVSDVRRESLRPQVPFGWRVLTREEYAGLRDAEDEVKARRRADAANTEALSRLAERFEAERRATDFWFVVACVGWLLAIVACAKIAGWW